MRVTKTDLEVLKALIGNVDSIPKGHGETYVILTTLVRQGNELYTKLEEEGLSNVG